jgi:hypothetical protein
VTQQTACAWCVIDFKNISNRFKLHIIHWKVFLWEMK